LASFQQQSSSLSSRPRSGDDNRPPRVETLQGKDRSGQ
jgi:hypothetical protein